jgi:uncharacterized protein YprB with RNaseH-like and TPR domain
VAIGLLRDGKVEVKFAGRQNERELLEWLRAELKGCDCVVTWYGSKFDLPFILSRAISLRVDMRELPKMRSIDLYDWCREYLKLSSYKLEDVANFIGARREVEFRGNDVHALSLLAARGNKEAMAAIMDHCKEDLILLKKIYEKLEPYLEVPRGEKVG